MTALVRAVGRRIWLTWVLAVAAVVVLGAAGVLALRQPPPVPGAVLPPAAPVGSSSTGPAGGPAVGPSAPAPSHEVSGPGGAPAGEAPAGVIPTRLRIPAVDGARAVDAPVVAGGTVLAWNPWLRQEVETFAVTDPRTPEGLATVTWWSGGPPVGELGEGGELSILLGHNSGRGTGVFDEVAMLPVGALVEAESAGGDVVRLVIAEIRGGLPKDDESALVGALGRPPDGAVSALVTCTGDLRSVGGGRSHADNTIVFLARP